MGLVGLTSALKTTMKQIETAAEAGANASTNGYKHTQAIATTRGFRTEGSSTRPTNGMAGRSQIQYSLGAQISSVIDKDSGVDLVDTGEHTHVAIDGEGMFAVAKIRQLATNEIQPTVNPTLNTHQTLVAEYARLGAQLNAGGPFLQGNFITESGFVSGAAPGGGIVVGSEVAPINVIPLYNQARRTGQNYFGQANNLAAPQDISADGLDVSYTRVGEFHWDTVPVITPAGGAILNELKHTDNRLVTATGDFAVGWVNLNINHPTNKTPQWERGHMDVANLHDRAAGTDWVCGHTPVGANAQKEIDMGFNAVPCTMDNACVLRFQNLKQYTGIIISANGDITGNLNGQPVILGKIAAVRFDSQDSLRKAANSRYQATPAAGDPDYHVPGTGTVGAMQQGILEGSNVDMAAASITMATAKATHSFVNGALMSQLKIYEDDAQVVRAT